MMKYFLSMNLTCRDSGQKIKILWFQNKIPECWAAFFQFWKNLKIYAGIFENTLEFEDLLTPASISLFFELRLNGNCQKVKILEFWKNGAEKKIVEKNRKLGKFHFGKKETSMKIIKIFSSLNLACRDSCLAFFRVQRTFTSIIVIIAITMAIQVAVEREQEYADHTNYI